MLIYFPVLNRYSHYKKIISQDINRNKKKPILEALWKYYFCPSMQQTPFMYNYYPTLLSSYTRYAYFKSNRRKKLLIFINIIIWTQCLIQDYANFQIGLFIKIQSDWEVTLHLFNLPCDPYVHSEVHYETKKWRAATLSITQNTAGHQDVFWTQQCTKRSIRCNVTIATT